MNYNLKKHLNKKRKMGNKNKNKDNQEKILKVEEKFSDYDLLYEKKN